MSRPTTRLPLPSCMGLADLSAGLDDGSGLGLKYVCLDYSKVFGPSYHGVVSTSQEPSRLFDLLD